MMITHPTAYLPPLAMNNLLICKINKRIGVRQNVSVSSSYPRL